MQSKRANTVLRLKPTIILDQTLDQPAYEFVLRIVDGLPNTEYRLSRTPSRIAMKWLLVGGFFVTQADDVPITSASYVTWHIRTALCRSKPRPTASGISCDSPPTRSLQLPQVVLHAIGEDVIAVENRFATCRIICSCPRLQIQDRGYVPQFTNDIWEPFAR